LQKEGIGVIYLYTYKQNKFMEKVEENEMEENMGDDSFVVAIEKAIMEPSGRTI
jgi:hypothetical protein